MAIDRYYFETLPSRRRSRRNIAGGANLSAQLDAKIPYLLVELDREIALLDESIHAEEGATNNRDEASINYSLMARSMQVRRANLLTTRSALVARLQVGQAPLNPGLPVSTVKSDCELASAR